jgi:Cu/Ag efflux protein CusF
MRSKIFWLVLAFVLLVLVALLLYLWVQPTQPHTMRHALTGYVLEVTPEMNRITVRNADVPGIMASMVMDYRVTGPTSLAAIRTGDIIQATMVVDKDGGYRLEDIKVTGRR